MKIATTLTAAALLAAASLSVAPDANARSRVHVRATPPPARVVVAPAKVWVPGHWTVTISGARIYVSGGWKVPPRVNSHWVPGRYVGHGRNRHWVPGHWS